MYVKIWYDMGAKCSEWMYISHYEFRKVFGLEEPKEIVIRRCDELITEGFFRMPARIDEAWTRLQQFQFTRNLPYLVVPDKIVCVFRNPCI